MTARIYKGKHIKKCECFVCIRAKLKKYTDRCTSAIRDGGMPKHKQIVPIRAHFRKHPNYLKSDPVLRRCIESVVKGILRQHGF